MIDEYEAVATCPANGKDRSTLLVLCMYFICMQPTEAETLALVANTKGQVDFKDSLSGIMS